MMDKKYLLLGMGVGNTAVKRYFDSNNILYQILDSDKVPEYDILVKSSGISPSNLIVESTARNNKLVLSDLGLYSTLIKDDYVVGVTGSNGKTTTSTLIYNILSSKYKVALCGNIGNPIFENIDIKLKVIECSSYMLDDCYMFRPNIFVILNIKPHHLDYHKTFINYIKAKIKCIKNMCFDDYLIYNYDDLLVRKIVETYDCHKLSFSRFNDKSLVYLKENIVYFNNKKYLKLDLINEALYDDFMASILVSKIFEIDDLIIKNTLNNFEGIEHRYEIFYKSDDLICINDSKATNPEATLRAFESTFTHFKDFQTLWIGGGKICNENFELLKEEVEKFDFVYLFGENKEILKNKLNLTKVNQLIFPRLEDVINDIFKMKKGKLLVLFSPASPSFDQYKNYEERGNKFKELIRKRV